MSSTKLCIFHDKYDCGGHRYSIVLAPHNAILNVTFTFFLGRKTITGKMHIFDPCATFAGPRTLRISRLYISAHYVYRVAGASALAPVYWRNRLFRSPLFVNSLFLSPKSILVHTLYLRTRVTLSPNSHHSHELHTFSLSLSLLAPNNNGLCNDTHRVVRQVFPFSSKSSRFTVISPHPRAMHYYTCELLRHARNESVVCCSRVRADGMPARE